MFNIIFYGSNEVDIGKDTLIVDAAFKKMDIDYRRYQFFNCANFLEVCKNNKIIKIYVIHVLSSEIKIISKIREYDTDSSIILITDELIWTDAFKYKLELFDLICDDDYDENLTMDMEILVSNIYRNKFFEFKYRHILYRIPYGQINYIEKEPAVKRCRIHTESETYYVVNSIEKLNEILGYGFMKTHKACVVNMNNVTKINLTKNLIIFKNGDETMLLADKVKKEVSEKIALKD